MYYSYKSKKNSAKKYKFLLIVLIISTVIYCGYRYKQYIFFWEYTYNKLCAAKEEINHISDKNKKIERLKELIGICDNYNSENQISPEAFSLSGKAHYELGQLYLGSSFSELLIYDNLNSVNSRAQGEFVEAIKDLKKMIALSGTKEINPEDHLILAISCFYTDYYPIERIFEILENIHAPDTIKNIEFIRFIAIIDILKGYGDRGIEFLKKYDNNSDSMIGRLFMAGACRAAEKYTNAIIEFKGILDMTADEKIIKLVNISLGKIYFTQSLFRESLEHFTSALKIDTRDNQLKIWIGKNYSAMGHKTKAKAIWSEVLASDHNNKEARRLLGLM